MCTLILGLETLGPGTLVLGANRDESPERPSADPAVLLERPRVVGGRDLVARGTWLAVRDGRFVAALMNRRPLPGDPTDPSRLRSRGLLCLDAAAIGPPPGGSAARIDPETGQARPARLDAALRLFDQASYSRCTLVGLDPSEGSWAIHGGGGSAPRAISITPGWHVITHMDLDDAGEPRTRALLERLAGATPRNVEEAFRVLSGLLSSHGDRTGLPPVCLHRDRFPTVSSSLLALGDLPDGPRYRHASGPPCVTPYDDLSRLLI